MADLATTDVSQAVDNLATNVKTQPDIWWKILGGVLLIAGVWWCRYLLAKKSQELADAKNELAKMQLAAEAAAMAAKVETDVAKAKVGEDAAAAAQAKVTETTAAIAAVEAEHQANVAKVEAIAAKDWDALNKLAGVTP